MRDRRLERYLDGSQRIATSRNPDPDGIQALEALGRKISVSYQPRKLAEESIFQSFIAEILADGHVDEEEEQTMHALERLFVLDPGESSALKTNAFIGLLSAVSEDFDDDMEARVRDVARKLVVDHADVSRHLEPLIAKREERRRLAAAEAVAERRRAERRAEQARREAERQVELEKEYALASEIVEKDVRIAISPSVNLQKREIAWFEVEAREIRRLRKRDERHHGKLLVTTHRVLFVHEGTTSIRLNKLLDAAVDRDMGILRLIKDGRKAPYEFELAQPLVAMAHVERSLEGLENGQNAAT